MDYLQNFLHNIDLQTLVSLVARVISALICIIIHECAHGMAADSLGDHTARSQGRLSWNPLRHIDPFGLLMMITAGVGWAKPVPVDARNFKKPKRGMALTALAGPASNLLLAMLALVISKWLFRCLNYISLPGTVVSVVLFLYNNILRLAVMSIGLGLFNLIPIPPLDGSKVLFSVLPNRIYFTILRYERYISLVLFALVFLGVLDGPLNYCISQVFYGLSKLVGF